MASPRKQLSAAAALRKPVRVQLPRRWRDLVPLAVGKRWFVFGPLDDNFAADGLRLQRVAQVRSVRSLTTAYPFLRGADAWRASLDVVVPPFEPKLRALLEWASRSERVAVVWVEGRRSPHDVLVTGLHDRTVTSGISAPTGSSSSARSPTAISRWCRCWAATRP